MCGFFKLTFPRPACSNLLSIAPFHVELSLFQAPRETREGKGEGTKTRGTGGEKRKSQKSQLQVCHPSKQLTGVQPDKKTSPEVELEPTSQSWYRLRSVGYPLMLLISVVSREI